MGNVSWYFRPIFIFIFSLVALGSSLFMYIRSYLEVNNAFHLFVQKHNLQASQLLKTEAWVTILTLSILVSIILIGLAIIYVYYNKVIQLYRLQQNFISGFTHELKTPLASLRLFIDTFRKHELPRNEQVKYLDFMLKDTERLSDNVQQILNLGKIEERNFKPQLEQVNIVDFIKKHIERNTYLFEGIDIQIKESNEYTVTIDKSLFEIMINNFITNAIQYGKDENKKIEINFNQNKKFLEITFKDNGIGFDPKEGKQILKKFYQIGKTTKGSGLGLYMCQQIAKVHSGFVKATSNGKGEGSQFIVMLPI